MSAFLLSAIAGRPREGTDVVGSISSALDLLGAHKYDESIYDVVAAEGYGLAKADSFICRDITTLSIATKENLASVAVLSPSLIPYGGTKAPLVTQVLPFISDGFDDATFFTFIVDSDFVGYNRPVEGFMRKTDGLTPEDYLVTKESVKIRQNDFIVPFEIEGMKSFSSFALPYEKELVDSVQSAEKDQSVLRALINVLEKLDSQPREMEAMLELEFGPALEFYWMAYASLIEHENLRDRELTKLYSSFNKKLLVVTSPFETKTVIFSEKTIAQLKDEHGEYLAKNGLDLTAKDLRVVA